MKKTTPIIESEISEISFKIVFSIPEGYSCFTEKSQDILLDKLNANNINVISSGNGFGTFGIEIEVDNYNDIPKHKSSIDNFAESILKLEKIKKPEPPRKKDVYSNIFDFSGSNKYNLKRLSLEQVVYSDDRLYQKIFLERDYALNGRNLLSKIKKNTELTSIISNMSLYNFGGNSLAITLNQGLTLTHDEFINLVDKIMTL